MEPTTGYAVLGDQRIAYQVIGDAPIDLVYTSGFFGSFDVEWEEPAHRLFFRQLADFARVIRFDQRGTGASDPVPLDALPPWEAFAEEIEVVMDAVGSEQAVIVAGGPATPVGMLFAATRPERVRALILSFAAVRYLKADDYPIGWSQEEIEAGQARFEEGWGTGQAFDLLFPSRAGDPRLRRWYAKLERSISSPGVISRYQRAAGMADARSLLPAVSAPTLVMHPRDNAFLPAELARYVADHIEGATFLEIPTADVQPWWDQSDLALRAIEGFVLGARGPAKADRLLSTVLFTDIVDSTAQAERLGDRRWSALLDLHDSTATNLVEGESGRVVKTTGDGILATFEGPGRAIRCAISLRDELAGAELRIRAGIHTGEVERRGDDIGGLAVHLAARIMSRAEAGELLVSGTVKDLVMGSDVTFEDRGAQEFEGLAGRWQVFSVVHPAVAADHARG